MKTPLILITGGRNYSDFYEVSKTLDEMYDLHPNMAIVQGGANGADELARMWCRRKGVPYFTCDAHWATLKNGAGIIRNQWMLDHLPISFVIAFPGGNGTADMVRRARAANIQVIAEE